MKKILFLILMLALVLSLFACGDAEGSAFGTEKEDEPTTETGTDSEIIPDVSDTKAESESEEVTDSEPEPEYINIENIGEYAIVRSKASSVAVKNIATDLAANIYVATELLLTVNTDDKAESLYEIIIGETARAVDGYEYGNLGLSSFVIKQIGSKIIIDGGSEKALKNALQYFSLNLISEEGVKMPFSGEYIFAPEGLMDVIKVDGVSIAEYTVIGDLYDDSIAEAFAEDLALAANIQLPVKNASEMKTLGEKYILLSDTNTDFTTHSVRIENGNIILYGNYTTIDECIDYFFTELLRYDVKNGKPLGDGIAELSSGTERIFTVEKKEVYSKEKLLSVLEDVYNSENIIVGQHMSAYRGGDTLNIERELYKENLNVDCPLFGYDVAEAQANKNLDWNAQVKNAYDMVEYAREGGIFSFSSHFSNPSGLPNGLAAYRGELGDGTVAAWDRLLTEGTDYYNTFMKDLAYVGDFLQIFHDNGVPIIWRPLHEMNGDWFWFCIVNGEENNLIPAEYASRLWIMIYDYLVKERGLDSLIWEYSPNVASGKLGTESSVMYCYPGDEYCDIVGCDWYTGNYKGHDVLRISEKELQATGKIFSVTEFGPSGSVRTDFDTDPAYKFNCSHLDELITEVTEGGIKTCYWMLWSSWAQVKISMWNMGNGEFFYENDAYLTLEDTYKLLYE